MVLWTQVVLDKFFFGYKLLWMNVLVKKLCVDERRGTMVKCIFRKIFFDSYLVIWLYLYPEQPKGWAHLFQAKTIKYLDKTLATQHLTPQNDPKNYPQIWPPNMTQKWTKKITLQNDHSKRYPLIHAHKAQDRAEINIIRYMKRVNFCLQNWCDSPNKFQLRISRLL